MSMTTALPKQEKEALLLMFGPMWQKRFWALDGQNGRPSLSQCIDFAMRRKNSRSEEDLVDYLERYLSDMSRRCQVSASAPGL